MEDLLDDEAIREKVLQLEAEAQSNIAKQMNNVLKDALGGGGFQNIFGEGIKIPALALSPAATNSNSPTSPTPSKLRVGKIDSVSSKGNKTPAPVTLIPILQ